MEFTYTNLFHQISNMKNNYLIHFFIIALIIDMIAKIANNYFSRESKYKIDCLELTKHIIILFIILTIYPYLSVLNFQSYGNSIVIFYIGYYGTSSVSQLKDIGIVIPDGINKTLKFKSENKHK